jgi:uncharacterized protein YcnI
MRRLALIAALGLAIAAAVPAAAMAHVQVSPSVAAPADPTLFTLLVPNESDSPTVQIDLKIPDGVIPFSFEETPGWERTEQRTENGALDVVTWKGSLPAGAFVRFSFLASTPDTTGQISWPAVQRYEDGSVVRWIGAPDSDAPAAITAISADAPRQNAGGEGAGEPAATTGTPTDTAGAAVPAPATDGGEDEGGTSALSIIALVIAGAGLMVGLAALLRARRGGSRA